MSVRARIVGPELLGAEGTVTYPTFRPDTCRVSTRCSGRLARRVSADPRFCLVAQRLPTLARVGCLRDRGCETVISYTGPTRAICRLLGDRVLGRPETITGGNSQIGRAAC